MSNRKTVTIFEGCDGSGKTTAAQAFAKHTGARYVHSGPYPQVGGGLARFYAEAMLPAVLGYQDVVMDRSWLSEQPYGAVYRNGSDRVGAIHRRMLERLALSCGALVIRCDPGAEVCVANWLGRRGQEYLDHADEVEDVNRYYRMDLRTELTIVDYDYTQQVGFYLPEILDNFRSPVHAVEVASAGHWSGRVALIGDSFGEQKDGDLSYRWPFASFSGHGCSRWLTEQLIIGEIPEWLLFWANADMLPWTSGPNLATYDHVIALGDVAHKKLVELGYDHHAVAHPQYIKRFNHGQPYELVTLLKELLG